MKTLFRTKFTIEAVSESPISDVSLFELVAMRKNNEVVITEWEADAAPVSAYEAAKILLEANSDPEIFEIDEYGSDIE